ncbi:MAG: BatD family protein [Candidatus Latescibacterota bacterium]|nr:BatD family protein [Candidatus Latescibacterota bacterium]
MPSLLVALLAALVATTQRASAQIEFSAAVDRNRASVAEAINLTLTISSPGSLDHVSAPELDLSAFDVFGPSVSTRVNFINGRSSFARVLTYKLYGRQPGRYRIGPVRLSMGGEDYLTDVVPVEIVRASPRSRGGEAGSGSGSATVDPESALEDNLFLRAVTDHDTVFVGQQVTVDFDLCYRFSLRDVGFAEIPPFSGFWLKELFVAQRLEPRRETIDGVAFHVVPLRKVALFPAASGQLEVEPMAVSCSISQGRRSRSSLFSLFDDPLFDRRQTVMVRSPALPVTVLPLPESGRPIDFNGVVGQFDLKVEVNPTSVDLGDPVTLRISVFGLGNMQSALTPVTDIDGFQVYDPQVSEEEEIGVAGNYGGRRNWEYILIPERSGELSIPALHLSYFDPLSRAYRQRNSKAIAITVGRGELASVGDPIFDLTRSEIEELGRDIRHIKPDVDALESIQFLHSSITFWLLQLAFPCAYLATLSYRRHQLRLSGDLAYARRRRARPKTERRLQAAAEQVAAGGGEFYGTLMEALVGYLADRFNQSAPSLLRSRCQQLLEEREVGETLRERFDTIVEECERGRFAPGFATPVERQRLLEQSRKFLVDLQEEVG